MVLATGSCSDQLSVPSLSPHCATDIYHAQSSNCDLRIALYETDQPSASRFRYMRQDLPYSQFMSEILNLGERVLKLCGIFAYQYSDQGSE